MVVLQKLKISLVLHAILYVEGEGEIVKDFLVDLLVVVDHGVE